MNTNQKIKELIEKYKFINKTSVDQIEYITLLAVICNLEALLEPCKHENKTCEWYRDSDDDEACFISSCNNNGFVLNDGGLKDNNMIYCNSCGCKIIETTHAEQERVS